MGWIETENYFTLLSLEGELRFLLERGMFQKKARNEIILMLRIFWIGIARFFYLVWKRAVISKPQLGFIQKEPRQQIINQSNRTNIDNNLIFLFLLPITPVTLNSIETPWRDQYPLLYFELAQGPEFTLERCVFSWKVIFCRWKADC
jgi:hypothetical protein